MKNEHRNKLIKLIETMNKEELELLISIINDFILSSSDHTSP